MISLSVLAIAKYIRKEAEVNIHGLIPFCALVLVFMVTVVSGVNSEDLSHWVRHLRLKLPFLILPFTFYLLRDTIGKYFYQILLSYVFLTLGSSVPVIYEMMFDQGLISDIKMGKSLSTPVDHIKYSLFVAFALLTCLILLIEDRVHSILKTRVILMICALLLFIVLHLLAVRSGLVVFYVSIFLLLIREAFRSRKVIFILPLLILIATPFIAFKTIPSFANKVHYTRYDFQMFKTGKGEFYSDSERWFSMAVGLKLFMDSPLLGTGVGDLKEECKKTYKTLYDIENGKYPHNQYLFILAGSGLLGLIMFLIGMVYPAFHFRKRLDSLFLTIMIIVMISFLVENTIERSYGIAFVLFFILSIMAYKSSTYFREEMASSPQSK